MKRKITALLCIGILLLGGCAEKPVKQDVPKQSEVGQERKEQETEEQKEKEQETADDKAYIGEYADSDAGGMNLEIGKGDDSSYIVQIGIAGLTYLEDGVGELTAEGMKFTATDAAGNPISGIITVEGKNAMVIFTDSTWEYLENGDSFQYIKSSDIPNIGSESQE